MSFGQFSPPKSSTFPNIPPKTSPRPLRALEIIYSAMPGRAGQLHPTARAGEMVGVEGVALSDHSPALSLAEIRSDTLRLLVCSLKDYDYNIVIRIVFFDLLLKA